ncbi:hypothetical protein ACGFIF_42945 [Kribbella sp. NPDC049174]|uniref:hypothetical protein n=1 Tax=Kribbella sp. NPDC049174 TaxID=3364112 RepID=UPI00372241D2
MTQLTDAQVLELARRLEHDQTTAVRRVLSVVEKRQRFGVRIGLTDRECAVITAAAAGGVVPPHPYREQWELMVIVLRRDGGCPFCDQPAKAGTEGALWPPTGQWEHRSCVEAKAEAEPPTKELRRRGMAVAGSFGRARLAQR